MSTGIGDTLRAARRQQSRSLSDAAAETRIRESYLAALEQEEFASLGGDVYVKGFLRSYARYLRVDPDPLIAAYRRDHERNEEPATPRPAGRTRSTRPTGGVGGLGGLGPAQGMSGLGGLRRPSQPVLIGGAVLLVIIILALIGLLRGDDDGGTAVAPPAVVPSTPAGENLDPVAPAEPPTTPPPGATEADAFTAFEAVLTVTGQASYVRVDSGTPTFEEELIQGESRTISSDDALVIRIGDAAAVELVVNGEDIGPLGEPAQVVVVRCEVGETACDIEPIT